MAEGVGFEPTDQVISEIVAKSRSTRETIRFLGWCHLFVHHKNRDLQKQRPPCIQPQGSRIVLIIGFVTFYE
jgi:hypothetical protein